MYIELVRELGYNTGYNPWADSKSSQDPVVVMKFEF